MKLSVTGVGTDDSRYISDRQGSGLLPLQVEGDGATTFRVLAKAHAGAPWFEILAPQTADLLESISWVPHVRLEVTSGSGTVNAYIATS